MNEDWRKTFGILMCAEICDGAGAGICDGASSTCSSYFLTLLLLSMTCPVLANSVDPDQLASEEAN